MILFDEEIKVVVWPSGARPHQAYGSVISASSALGRIQHTAQLLRLVRR